MRWNDIIFEAWFDKQDVHAEYFQGEADLYQNPTRVEFGKLMREHGLVRGFFDQNDLYVWRGDVLHHDIEVPGQHWIIFGPNAVSVDWNAEAEGYDDPEDHAALVRFVQTHPRIKPFVKDKPIRVRMR